MLSIQIKAFSRWVAAVAVLLALKFMPNPPAAVGWVLWSSLGLLLVSALFWPRCPHCRAHAVQINKLEWVPGDTCWRCHRPYDESQTPVYTFELDQAVEEAEKIRTKDPTLYERLLRDAERRFEAAYEAEKASLRERAKVDAAAAGILATRLKRELKGLNRAQKTLRKKIDKDPGARETLRHLESDARSIQVELQSIEANMALLPKRSRAAV